MMSTGGDMPELAELERSALFNVYYDPAHYDERYRGDDEDLDYWRGVVVRFGPKVLELACGSGRVTIPMAAAGGDVTGIDISPLMLAAARRKAAEAGVAVRLVHGDVRRLGTGDTYPVIAFPCGSICHLITRDDLAACLGAVRAELTADGVFVIDAPNPDLSALAADPDTWIPRFRYSLGRSGRKVAVVGRRSYDRATQVLTDVLDYTIEGEPGTSRACRRSRMYFPEELLALLSCSGFEITERFGGYAGEPFDSTSPIQLIVCRRRGDSPSMRR